VEYVSKRGALAHLQSFLGKGALEGVSTKAFPASLLLTMGSEYRMFQQVAPLASELQEREGVEEVEFGREWLKKLDRTAAALSLVTLILGVLIAAAVVVIVSNFMRFVAGSQAETIRIMSLLGASRGKAALPLLIQGLLLGGAGASLAILCLWMVYSVLTKQTLSTTFLPLYMIPSLIVWGMILGACGTFVSSTRYLKS
jgi:cell division transport system permease protein